MYTVTYWFANDFSRIREDFSDLDTSISFLINTHPDFWIITDSQGETVAEEID